MGRRRTRWIRTLFRVPLPLFRAGVGRRVLRGAAPWIAITARGRRTGKPHTVLVDCLLQESASGPWYVQATYGTDAGWVRNITANPRFEVETGDRSFTARARHLTREEALPVLRRAVAGHPLYVRLLAWFMGARASSKEHLARWFSDQFLTLELRRDDCDSGARARRFSGTHEPPRRGA